MSVTYSQTRTSIKRNYRRSAAAPEFFNDHKQKKAGMKFHAYDETWQTVIDESNPPPGTSMLMKQEDTGQVYEYVDNVAADDPGVYYATSEYYDLVLHDKAQNRYHRLNLVKND